MTWVYLVKFTQDVNPQRQQIDVNFTINNRAYRSVFDPSDYNTSNGTDIHRSTGLEFPSTSNTVTGVITTRINHTVRRWGIDVDNLILGYMKSIIERNESGFRSFVIKYSAHISWITSVLATAAAVSVFISILLHYRNVRIADYNNHINNQQNIVQDMQAKITYLGKFLVYSESVIPILLGVIYAILSLVLVVSMSVYVSNKAGLMYPSFVVLSGYSKSYKNKIEVRYKKGRVRFLLTFIISCIAGVGGNIITYYVWRG